VPTHLWACNNRWFVDSLTYNRNLYTLRILGYDCSNASLSRADYVQRQSVRAKKKRTKRAERRKELEPIRIESAEFGKYTFEGYTGQIAVLGVEHTHVLVESFICVGLHKDSIRPVFASKSVSDRLKNHFYHSR